MGRCASRERPPMDKDCMLVSLKGLVGREIHPLTNLANAAALLYGALRDINWCGFYLLDGGALRLGPFGGKPACPDIVIGKGVCGTSFAANETLVVPDVRAFAGHIVCDMASRSEIVVPLRRAGVPVGVLDADSPLTNRFSLEDQNLLEAAVCLIENACDFDRLRYDLS